MCMSTMTGPVMVLLAMVAWVSARMASRHGPTCRDDSIIRPPPMWRLLPWGAGMPLTWMTIWLICLAFLVRVT